jgi:hypothetical protein
MILGVGVGFEVGVGVGFGTVSGIGIQLKFFLNWFKINNSLKDNFPDLFLESNSPRRNSVKFIHLI